MTQLGELSLWLALLMTAWSTTLSIEGAVARRSGLAASGARGLYAALGFLAVATAGLLSALLGDDFSLRYVAQHSASNLPRPYVVCALWAGPEGSWLLSAFLLAGAASAAAAGARRRGGDRTRAAWAVAVLGLCVAALLAVAAFHENPFARSVRPPADGRGLDPQLQSAAMAFAPPLFLFGAVAAAVPLALAAAALITRRTDAEWRARLRAWALAAWAPLTAAMVLGAHWAYVSPAWSGFWARNPARTAGAAAWAALSLVLGVSWWLGRGAPRAGATVARRRAGGALVALAALLVAASLAGRAFAKHYDVELGDGERYVAKDAWGRAWTLTSQGASRIERPGYDVVAVALLPVRGAVREPFLVAESREYYAPSGLNVYPPRTVPAIRSTLAQDVYVVLSDAGEGRSALRIGFRPLVEPAWIGGALFVLGGLLLFAPSRAEWAA